MRSARSLAIGALAVGLVGAVTVGLRVGRGLFPVRPAAWRPNPSAAAAHTVMRGGVRHIERAHAPDLLLLDSGPPAPDARLLWFEGRAVITATDDTYVVDHDGRLLSINRQLRARSHVIAGRADTWRTAMMSRTGDLWLTDASSRIVRVDGRDIAHDVPATSFAAPQLVPGRSGNVTWLVRSTAQLTGTVDSAPAPLLLTVDTLGTVTRRVGVAHRPAHVLLEAMANAGYLAARGEMIYLAPFIRDQLVAMRETGETTWVATRGLSHTSGDPRFEVSQGSVVIDYHPVNLGLAFGPDSLLYLLSTANGDMTETRLDVFDPQSGALLRTAFLASVDPTLAVDRRGRVHVLSAVFVRGASDTKVRIRVPELELSGLTGGRIATRAFRGRITLLNFWASWCGPCRAEMPSLDTLQRRVSGEGVAFVSVNEDADTAAALGFMRAGHLRFPVARGGPHLHEQFGALGLPLTLLVDGEGREIRRWTGYAGSAQIAEIASAIASEQRTTMGSMDMAQHRHPH